MDRRGPKSEGRTALLVSCGNCDTEYELNEAKIPAGGARLRCTTCSHYFVVSPPEPSDFRAAESLARDAFSPPAPRVAEPEPERSAAPEDEFDPEVESDWEFNDVIDAPEPEEAAEEPESAFDRDGGWGELGEAEDVVDDLLGGGGGIEDDPAAAVDDLLGEFDLGDSALDAPEDEPQTGSKFSSADLDIGEAEAPESVAEDLAGGGGDPLGDLADWDLFDQPAEAEAASAAAGASSQPSAAARSTGGAEPRVEIAVAMAADAPREVRMTDRIGAIAGWAAVAGLVVVALVAGLSSHSSEARAPAGRWSGGGFEADQIAGRWVDNAVAGSIYVVSGRLRGAPNASPDARKALGIRLIDGEGRDIDRDPIPVAPEIPERILRESSPAELDAFQARRAGQLAAVGEYWVPFEAVLTELPPFADRFALEEIEP